MKKKSINNHTNLHICSLEVNHDKPLTDESNSLRPVPSMLLGALYSKEEKLIKK